RPRLTPRQAVAIPHLQFIAEAVLISEETGAQWAIAEVLRIKAGLLLASDRPTEEVEDLLVNGLQIARRQRARSWELRTTSKVAVRKLCSWYKRFTISSLKASIPRISGTPKRCWPS